MAFEIPKKLPVPHNDAVAFLAAIVERAGGKLLVLPSELESVAGAKLTVIREGATGDYTLVLDRKGKV